MKKFTLVWNEFDEWRTVVEAKSKKDALKKFGKGECPEGEIYDSQFADEDIEVWEWSEEDYKSQPC